MGNQGHLTFDIFISVNQSCIFEWRHRIQRKASNSLTIKIYQQAAQSLKEVFGWMQFEIDTEMVLRQNQSFLFLFQFFLFLFCFFYVSFLFLFQFGFFVSPEIEFVCYQLVNSRRLYVTSFVVAEINWLVQALDKQTSAKTNGMVCFRLVRIITFEAAIFLLELLFAYI